MCPPKAPDLSAQRREAKRQQEQENQRKTRDKQKRLAERTSSVGAARLQSLVSLSGATGTGGRSFFAPTGS